MSLKHFCPGVIEGGQIFFRMDPPEWMWAAEEKKIIIGRETKVSSLVINYVIRFMLSDYAEKLPTGRFFIKLEGQKVNLETSDFSLTVADLVKKIKTKEVGWRVGVAHIGFDRAADQVPAEYSEVVRRVCKTINFFVMPTYYKIESQQKT